jgi:thiol-disulfide isomerase/thioredoxin
VKSKISARMTLPAEEYVKRFGGFPTAGKEVQILPYLKARVEKIGEKEVTLLVSAKDGDSFDETFGKVTISVGPDAITLNLAPRLGALFNNGERRGVITASDTESFTVDYNDPLAGKTVVLDLEAISVTKMVDLKTGPIDWIEDRDAGLAEAKKEGKPLFLILYADWCQWCKKTFTETLPDPRIGRFRDKFVWMKLNSDKEQKYKQMYGQKGYPMMIILRADGTILKKIDGYRDARGLKGELEGALAAGV